MSKIPESDKSMISDEKTYFYMCQSCKWNSISIGITAKNMLDIYARQTFSSQQKGKDKGSLSAENWGSICSHQVFEACLDRLKTNQEEIMKREKKEVRQKKKTNLVEEFKGSGVKERTKYTHEMFKQDQEIREKEKHANSFILGSSVTQDILSGRQELKYVTAEIIKKGFKDFTGRIF